MTKPSSNRKPAPAARKGNVSSIRTAAAKAPATNNNEATPVKSAPLTKVCASDLLTRASLDIMQRSSDMDEERPNRFEDDTFTERTMSATVTAFNAIEGTQLTERQGWAFMQLLNMKRAARASRHPNCNGGHNWAAKHLQNAIAYAALAGEADDLHHRFADPTRPPLLTEIEAAEEAGQMHGRQQGHR